MANTSVNVLLWWCRWAFDWSCQDYHELHCETLTDSLHPPLLDLAAKGEGWYMFCLQSRPQTASILPLGPPIIAGHLELWFCKCHRDCFVFIYSMFVRFETRWGPKCRQRDDFSDLIKNKSQAGTGDMNTATMTEPEFSLTRTGTTNTNSQNTPRNDKDLTKNTGLGQVYILGIDNEGRDDRWRQSRAWKQHKTGNNKTISDYK